MRTTVTLDADVAALIEKEMRSRRASFKATVNAAIRAGLTGRSPATAIPTPTFHMGEPSIPLTRALTLAADFEDEETARRLMLRK